MDNGSVISLSSTSSRASPPSVRSMHSEVQRVPVSWDSGDKDQDEISKAGDSPNNHQKVNEWMKSCEVSQTTCIRYDFDKRTKAPGLPASCFTRATPLFSYMQKAKASGGERPNGKHRSNGVYDTPLSPNTQKEQLCSYLQLMKPGDNSSPVLLGSRRSVRLKNRVVGRSEVAKKINFEEFEKVVSDVVNYSTIKSFEDLNVKLDKVSLYLKQKRGDSINKFLPLPEKNFDEFNDFEESVRGIVDEVKSTKVQADGGLKKIENKRKKFKFALTKRQFKYLKGKTLRSRWCLRDISLDTLILRRSRLRLRKARTRIIKKLNKTPETKELVEKTQKILESPRCEIVSVHTTSDDENIDLKNFVDDMLELDKMSEEHRKSVIESRILASSSITNLINKQINKEKDVQRAYKIFSDLSNERKSSADEKENSLQDCQENTEATLVPRAIISDHDYAIDSSEMQSSDVEEDVEVVEEDLEEDVEVVEESIDDRLSAVPIPDIEVQPVSKTIEIKSLHRSLTMTNKRKLHSNYGVHNWTSNPETKRLNHSISISKKHGPILKAFYQDYHLVVAQRTLVSFWTQSALGNVLGAQNMWIPHGECQRILLNSTYKQKDAMEMVVSTETSLAYVELWTKEHKSEVREVPVADVFATVYFWRLRQGGLDKKVLQLENIKGFSDDVQYCVLKCYPRVIVSWHSIRGGEKTKIHAYHLAADFQTVANISEIQPVEHYVSSLHTIEDCDNLVMGCGENKITLWNVEYGYILATIELSNIAPPVSTLWVKCDRGFLFTIQESVDQELRLIAINGMNHSWKKLQTYNCLKGFDGLKGVCVENGILVAVYAQGMLCWNAQSGEMIVEDRTNDCDYIPSGKYVIVIVNDKIVVRHSLSQLVAGDEF